MTEKNSIGLILVFFQLSCFCRGTGERNRAKDNEHFKKQ